MVLGLLFVRVRDIRTYRRRLLQAAADGPCHGSGGTVRTDHWTAVASRDIFEQTAQMVSWSQLMVYGLVLLTTGMTTVALVRNTLERLETYEGQLSVRLFCCPECEPFDTSCPCDTACIVSNAGLTTFLTLNVGLMVCLIESLLFIPLAVWSPVVDAAFSNPANRKLHHIVLQRTRRLPVPLAVLAVINLISFVIYGGSVAVPAMLQGVVLWWGVLVLNVSTIAVSIVLIIWTAGPRRLALFPAYALRLVSAGLQVSLSFPCNMSVAKDVQRERYKRLAWFFRSPNSWRYRQLVLLIACGYCWSVEALNLRLQGMIELYITRILSLLLLVVARDEEGTLEALTAERAGFGLVASAKHLQQALLAHLNGQQCTGRVPLYKATELRMQETLAVSYRWHDEHAIDLEGPGTGTQLKLNMTAWQAGAVVRAIESTGSRYVWIDTLAIPATSGDWNLQKTLLSRMMAVYSAASVTLALRSTESEGHRYHQRVWTLQEFCAAKRVIVQTQSDGQVEVAVEPTIEEAAQQERVRRITSATDAGEDLLMEQLREQCLLRQARCVPAWLVEGGMVGVVQRIPPAEAQRIWATYQHLASHLHCRYTADKVRALYPLLWNSPAESESELLALVDALETVHGISQVEARRLLTRSPACHLSLDSAPECEETVAGRYDAKKGVVIAISTGTSESEPIDSDRLPAPIHGWPAV